MRLSRLSLFREKLNFSDNRDYCEAIIAISRLKDISIYCPLPSLQPYIPSTVLCPLYGPLSPLRLYIPCTALCPFYIPMSLYDPVSSLRFYVPSTAPCPLYDPLPPLPPLQSSVPSTASVLSSVLCPLYTFKKHNGT
jgi:hypothetical protein